MIKTVCFLLPLAWAIAFTPSITNKRHSSRRYGIAEWRDTMLLEENLSTADWQLSQESGPPREVCILPFPFEEVLLQGETKQLRLYEDRFIELYEDAVANHGGVVAMGLLAESGVIKTVPLCEIEAANRMEDFGIFLTIRVVGRAQLHDLTQQEPYIKAICSEIYDEVPSDMEMPNVAATSIENSMLLLSSMEHRLEQANQQTQDELSEEDAEMQRRINIAKMDDRFYSDLGDDEEDLSELDRRARFRTAYQVALDTDTQGYQVASTESERSAQELTAISWAAFCTDLLPELPEVVKFRIQALDTTNLLDRLKLASHMLQIRKAQLQEQMTKAGLKFRGDDVEEG